MQTQASTGRDPDQLHYSEHSELLRMPRLDVREAGSGESDARQSPLARTPVGRGGPPSTGKDLGSGGTEASLEAGDDRRDCHSVSRNDNRQANSNRSMRRFGDEELAQRRMSSTSGVPRPSGFVMNCNDKRYWDYAFRPANRGDIGHRCRECKRSFSKLNEAIAVRRGGRIELKYHEGCFSMFADPRTQPKSSANTGKFVEVLEGTVAPEEVYSKMRTRGHW